MQSVEEGRKGNETREQRTRGLFSLFSLQLKTQPRTTAGETSQKEHFLSLSSHPSPDLPRPPPRLVNGNLVGGRRVALGERRALVGL